MDFAAKWVKAERARETAAMLGRCVDVGSKCKILPMDVWNIIDGMVQYEIVKSKAKRNEYYPFNGSFNGTHTPRLYQDGNNPRSFDSRKLPQIVIDSHAKAGHPLDFLNPVELTKNVRIMSENALCYILRYKQAPGKHFPESRYSRCISFENYRALRVIYGVWKVSV